MPKLLSREEVEDISAKMTEEYGLPPPRIIINNYNGSYDSGLKCEIVRVIWQPVYDWFLWYKKPHSIKINDFYAENFEDILTKLQNELSKFNGRTSVAEQFREKYALKEADELLEAALRNK